jgi:hypothetical protein
MPGGRNSYTRPANKPQRAAIKRQKARNAAIDNLKSRRNENAEDKDQTIDQYIENDTALRQMIANIEEAGTEDRSTMRRGVEKAKERKANRYNYAKGGAVRKYKDGGAVCRGGGAAVSGTNFRGVR